ncbi:hypothetical protein PAXRUDRAFT_18848 [Paxillus rubicundulus Ve08.2h10]|uniref:Uncharacterized protein n=1 Tax=Paxillus rubicundulus Ve08.2h10 TaxID=930991 RepID=A0A0D0DDU1_9AGAM|nr:hypothetical protein PAXRUDRAFT_18848 [Paxillus rubicundulus Ve08.2h10]
MPCSLFTEEQLTLLEGVLDEYREISGQGKVARKEAIVTWVTQKFVTVHHENDIEATKKLQNIKEETRKLTKVAPGLPGPMWTWQWSGTPRGAKRCSDETGQVALDIIPSTGINEDGYESNGEIFRGMHDHNDSLDDGPTVKKVCPNWDKEPIGSTWETYLKNTFNAMKQVLSPTAADPKQKFELRKAEDGHWDLPPDDFLLASLELQSGS